MAARLQFLLGRAGSGKTYACLEAIRREVRRGPDGPPLVLLTPEQATFQMERALLAGSGLRATHRAHVLSFQRLAARVMQDTGLGARPLMGELGKRMVLRALIHRHGPRLQLFRKAARQAGFVDRLANTLKELRAYECSPDDLFLRHQLLGDGPHRLLAAKLHDLALIYQAFTKYVEGRFTDPDAVLTAVSEHLAQSPIARGARVWVDGFAGFTPQEFSVLRALWRVAERMEIALCLDPSVVDGDGPAAELDLFAPTRETYQQLLAMAREDGVLITETRVLPGTAPRGTALPRFAAAPVLAHLERELFLPRGRAFREEVGSDSLQVVAAANAREEVEAAAREIVRLVRERGWRYRDMAVIVRQLEGYRDLIAAVFRSYGIPHFIDSRRPLSHHPLTELVRSVLEIAATRWPTEAVVRCLKTDLLPLSRDEADRLENYAYEHGIDGVGWVRDAPWRFARRYTLDEEGASAPGEGSEACPDDAAALDEVRRRALDPVRRLTERLGRARTARDMAAALWDLLEELQVAAALEQWMESAAAAGTPEEVQEHAGAWQGILQVLDELVDALGDQTLTVAEFRQIVEAGLESLRIGLVPPGLDQVLVGSVERSRQPDIKAALVLGVHDGGFPLAPAEDVIFNDQEREMLAASRLVLSPTSRSLLLREQYLMYISLTRASRYLWVSYPTADARGRELAPSFIVRRLRELFPGLRPAAAPLEPVHDEGWLDRAVDADRLVAVLAARLRRHRAGEPAGRLWWQIYQWVAQDPQLRRRAERLFAALNHHNAVPPLPSPVARALFGSPLRSSVTRLESFAACPFQHFAAYGLGLRERPRWRLDHLQVGIFLHAALRRFVEILQDADTDWGQLDDETALGLADRCVDELLPRLGSELMLSSARHAFLGEVLRRRVRRAVWALTEHARRSQFRPVLVEAAFGRRGGALGRWTVALPHGERLELAGQVDRIDLARDRRGRLWLRVIDYKSSALDVRLGEVVHGLTLQLPIYLAVALHCGDRLAGAAGEPPGTPVLPAAAVYFPVRDPVLHQDAPVTQDVLDGLLRRELRMRGLFVDEPEVLLLMDDRLGSGSELLMVSLKKDGTVDQRSNVASLEDFAALTDYAGRQAAALAGRILAGEIPVAPYRLGSRRPCTTCPFHSVCQFDPLVEGNGYRRLPTLSRSEAWDRLRIAPAGGHAVAVPGPGVPGLAAPGVDEEAAP